MADLRIVDAPVLLQESITDDVKMPTGGLGNFSVRLGDILWYVITKEQLANKNYVDLSSKAVKDSLDEHIADKNNPHQVTKEQVGLGNVDNTADVDKPVSNAVSSAIITATTDMATKAYVNQKDNLKADKATTLSGYGITDAYTKDETYSQIEIDSVLTLKADVAYVDGKDGDLTTLKTTDKTNLVKAINEVYDSSKGVVALYDKNVEAGAGANGWIDLLVSTMGGRTQKDKNSESLSVYDFGAKGDGVTDDTKAFKDANAAATAKKQRLHVPFGEYLIPELLPLTCSVYGDGKILGELRICADNVTIEDITIDGQNKNTPLNLMGVKNVTVSNVTAYNANFGGIRLDVCSDCLLIKNHIYDIRNVFGDGICINRSKNIITAFNTIHDITRIGIVSDTDLVGEVSTNITAVYNTIYHAYGASGGELNGGIWFENTYGGLIHGNTIKDTNSVGNNKGRGIVVTALIKDGKDYPYFITNNTLTDTGWAIVTGSSDKNGAKVFVDNNSIHGDYTYGMYFGGGTDVKISNCYFDKGTVTLFRIGAYSDTADINMTIENCSYGNDVNFVPTVNLITTEGNKKCNLTINNLVGKWTIKQQPDTLNGKLKISNTDVVLLQGTTEQPCYISNFSSYQFNDVNFLIKSAEARLQGKCEKISSCSFIKDASVVNETRLLCSYVANDLTFSNAKFKGVDVLISLSLSANIEVLFKECLFSEYTKNAIRSYYSSSSYKLSVINSKFTDTEKTIPIGYEGGTAPNVTVDNVLHNASKVSSVPANVFNTYNIDVASQVILEYDPPSLANATQQSVNLTYNGLNVGDNVNVSFNAPLQGTRMWGEVTAANTVTVYHRNDTGAVVDLPYGILTVKIF